jgi:hypothetical protein
VNLITERGDNLKGREFILDNEALSLFRDYLDSREIEFTENDLVDNHDELEREIKQELLSTQEGLDAGYRFFLEDDHQVQKALTLFNQASELFKSSQKLYRLRQGHDTAEAEALAAQAQPVDDEATGLAVTPQ